MLGYEARWTQTLRLYYVLGVASTSAWVMTQTVSPSQNGPARCGSPVPSSRRASRSDPMQLWPVKWSPGRILACWTSSVGATAYITTVWSDLIVDIDRFSGQLVASRTHGCCKHHQHDHRATSPLLSACRCHRHGSGRNT